MGMDVYGTKPLAEVGEYFRRSVWGWRPLWDYCKAEHAKLVASVTEGHSNSGDGLKTAKKCEALANAIRADIASGKAQEYITKRNEYLASLPRTDCEFCHATGIRTDAVGVANQMHTRELFTEVAKKVGRTHGWCNACDGLGDNPDWQTHYYLDLEDLTEFSEFLANCGGFEIC